MKWHRLLIGLIGLGFLIVGSFMYFSRPDDATGFTGIAVRVGVLLCVIWLAMPQLETVRTKIPVFVLLTVLLMLIVVAVRPNLFRVLAGILAVSLAVSWALKWLSVLTTHPPKR